MITSVCIIAFVWVLRDFIGSTAAAIEGEEQIGKVVCGLGAALNFALLFYIFYVLSCSNF